MVSNVCSRSHGQPSGARSLAMMDTNRWNFSPADSGCILGAVSPQCSIGIMSDLTITRPGENEYAPYYAKYIELVPGADVLEALTRQIAETAHTLRAISALDSLRRYAEGKWSIREVIGHLIDTERVFAYRALRFGRGDATPLARFDQ